VLFDRGYVGLGVGVGILLLLFRGNWELAAIAAATHVVSYLLLNSAVNAVGHRYGRRPFSGLAANTQWLAWFTAGEGLHSNHHAAPTSARLAFHRGEIDPGWWPILWARKLRWVKVRHEQPRMARGARAPQPV
jgi:stearoyl-CoA desaturase (delta-9 desaturase)